MSEVKSEVVSKVSEEADTEKIKEPNQPKPLKNLCLDDIAFFGWTSVKGVKTTTF